MFLDFLRYRFLVIAAVFLPLSLIALITSGGQDWLRNKVTRLIAGNYSGAGASVEKMQSLLAEDERLLSAYEHAQSKLRAEVIRRRKLAQDGAVTKASVSEAEQEFVAALRKVHAMQAQVLETKIAITEAVLGEKVDRMPILEKNVFRETDTIARFTGGTHWSLKDAPAIQKYFAQTFGYSLPVSAYGQSATHDRLGLDHHNAMDVALYPESSEGQAMISHLRQAGIPFIVFKTAVAGAATGPHIHIGRPSVRVASR
jgi:hypothetical protein